MILTKQEAIKNHREMWNWIVKQYENESYKTINELKEEYLYEIKGEPNIINYDCYCCEYANNLKLKHRCYGCPLVWTEEDVKNKYAKDKSYFENKPYYCMNMESSTGLYEQLENLTEFIITDRTKVINLAKQIAELEERK